MQFQIKTKTMPWMEKRSRRVKMMEMAKLWNTRSRKDSKAFSRLTRW
jgi:hypothetical protein